MIFSNYSDVKDIKFDLIIVGSGPAGISLALELEDEKISILIIEAGKNKFDDESQSFVEPFLPTAGSVEEPAQCL